MREDTLREGLSLGQSSKMGSEAKGLGHRQEAPDNAHGSTSDLFFFIDNTSSGGQTVVHTRHGIGWGSDFTSEDRLLQGGLGSQFRGIVASSGCLDQLSSSSVDGIGM